MHTRTNIGYCFCCGKPKPIGLDDDAPASTSSAIVVSFLNNGRACICRQCAANIKPQTIRCYSMAALNPKLRKYEQDVQSGKIDIGLRVSVQLCDGTEFCQPVKTKADKVAY